MCMFRQMLASFVQKYETWCLSSMVMFDMTAVLQTAKFLRVSTQTVDPGEE